jgi:hypothetical protein
MSLKTVHETTRSSTVFAPIAAFPPIEWAAVIDDIVLAIWLRCKHSDVVGFARTCDRFYKLLINRRIGDVFWVGLARSSFPYLTVEQAQLSGPSFFKKHNVIWNSLRRANLNEGSSSSWVQQCSELPCSKIPESALLDNEGKGLLLCSKDMKVRRYGFDSATSNPAPQKTGNGDSAFHVLEGPVCMDRNGQFFAVGTDTDERACVNLLNIETGAVEKTFFVGAQNSHIKPPYSSDADLMTMLMTLGQSFIKKFSGGMCIQSLCATDRYVIALAKEDCNRASLGCMLIWDRNAPHGHRVPKMQFKIDSVTDMQLKCDTIYWVVRGLAIGCDLCFLNLDDIDKHNPKDVDFFIKKQVKRYCVFYRKEDGSDRQVEIKSFITEGSFIFFHCIANGISDLRIMKKEGGSWQYQKSLETVSSISHIRKESGFIAAFLEENNSVQFFDFSPDYQQLQSEINKELSPITNNLTSLGTFGLSQQQCFQYFDRHWLGSLNQIGISSLADFEMILNLLPRSTAPRFIPHFTDNLEDASLFIGGLVRGQKVIEKYNRWLRNKNCSFIANPWEPVSDKVYSLYDALRAHWKSNGSYSKGEACLELLKQVNAFIDEWNLATKIEILQMYICSPERINWWQGWSEKTGAKSLSDLPKMRSFDFELSFWKIFSKLN